MRSSCFTDTYRRKFLAQLNDPGERWAEGQIRVEFTR